MNIQEYNESGQHLYEEFSNVIKGILRSAISNNDDPYGIQQIQFRTKSVKSLSKKLRSRDIYHSDDIEDNINDLAGCRVILYHNDDLNAFLTSRIIYENFIVNWDQSKFHHPDTDAKSANDYYMANHFIVTLTDDRLKLPDFSKFAGLKCEIQIQTLLNHAWAETIHDITYKPREFKGFGAGLMESIDKRLKAIMTDYLRPAGFEFQKVKHDYNKLVQGQEIFDRDIIKDIEDADDNNVIHSLLERYKDYVLPNYTEYVSYSDEIYEITRTSLSRAKGLDVVDIETPYGSINGKSYKEILSVCLGILNYIRYLDIERTHSLFIDIYSTIADLSAEEVYVDYVERFAGYNYEIVTKHGLHVQEFLIGNLLDMPYEELLALTGYVFPVCKAILQPSFEKRGWTHDQVKIGTINLNGNETLKAIRHDVIELLEKLYVNGNDAVRVSVRSCLNVATSTPHVGTYSNDLLNIILSNTCAVVRIYTDNIERQSFEEIQIFEERVHFFYKRATQVSQNKEKPHKSRDIAVEIMALAIEYRAKVNSNGDYFKYKVLVGFISVFDQEWDDERWGWEEKEAFRDIKISEFVESIDNKNYAEWINIIGICAKTVSSDLATFLYFNKFLILLAKTKPSLALRFLKDDKAGLETFLIQILLGFVDSKRLDILDSVIKDYIKQGDRLRDCARLFALKPSVNRARLLELFEVAKKTDQISPMFQLITAVVSNTKEDTDELTELFLPLIAELTLREEANWIRAVWYTPEVKIFFGLLDKDQSKVVLKNLILLSEIDYHAEQIIMPIAKNYPLEVIEYFGERLSKAEQIEKSNRYNAIPFKFQKLTEPLSVVPEELVDIVLNWYNFDPIIFQYRGARLIAIIFPNFDDRLEAKLIDLCATGEDKAANFITSILRNYEGEVFLHNVCKALITTLPDDSQYLSEIRIVLQESGGSHGEFGYVKLCEQKKEEILYWIDDENPKIKGFAETYILSLDRQIAAEQKRAEEDIEMRKHYYGE